MSNNVGYEKNLESLRLRQVGQRSDDDRVDECLLLCWGALVLRHLVDNGVDVHAWYLGNRWLRLWSEFWGRDWVCHFAQTRVCRQLCATFYFESAVWFGAMTCWRSPRRGGHRPRQDVGQPCKSTLWLVSDSVDRLWSNRRRFRKHRSSSFRLVWMWCEYVRRISKWTPRYLTVDWYSIIVEANRTDW